VHPADARLSVCALRSTGAAGGVRQLETTGEHVRCDARRRDAPARGSGSRNRARRYLLIARASASVKKRTGRPAYTNAGFPLMVGALNVHFCTTRMASATNSGAGVDST